MQERQVSIEGTTHPLPDPFIVLATQNPVEFEGTFSLPQAQLDRFLLRIRIGYPDEDAERRIARRYRAEAEPLDAIRPVADAARLQALRDEVREVAVSDEVEAYAVAIVRATRAHDDLQLGASPRSSVALYRAAQASALLDGRAFVLPDDVRAIAAAVLTHRLVVDLDRSLRGRHRGVGDGGDPRPRPRPAVRSGRRRLTRMSGQAFAAVLLVLAGAFIGVPIIVVLGVVVLLLETIRAVWARYGLRGVTYRAAARLGPHDMGRRDPDDDRGLEPQAPAARLAPCRRRRELRGRRPGARSGRRQPRRGRPAQRLDARPVRAGHAAVPRDRRAARRLRLRSDRPVGRRPVRPPGGDRGARPPGTVHRPAADGRDDRHRAARPVGRHRAGEGRA